MIPQGMFGLFCKLSPEKIYVAWAGSDDEAERVFGEHGVVGELVFVNSAIADVRTRRLETVCLTDVPERERRVVHPLAVQRA